MVAAAGKTARWRVNLKVYADAPADTPLPTGGEDGYGAVLYHSHHRQGQEHEAGPCPVEHHCVPLGVAARRSASTHCEATALKVGMFGARRMAAQRANSACSWGGFRSREGGRVRLHGTGSPEPSRARLALGLGGRATIALRMRR